MAGFDINTDIYIYTKRVWQPVTNLLEGLHADFLPRSSPIYGALVSIQFFALSLSLDMNNDIVCY